LLHLAFTRFANRVGVFLDGYVSKCSAGDNRAGNGLCRHGAEVRPFELLDLE
jgi:hypothetical protein